MKGWLVLSAIILGAPSLAATVGADSLLCETTEPFAVIASDGWTTKGGVAQMNTARMSVQTAKLSGQFASAQRGLATSEETIRADSSRRLAAGSTTSRALTADSDAKSAAQSVLTYERIVASCAASGPAPLPAEILERKPISGLTRVRVQFNGALADLWLRRLDVTE